MTISKNRKAAGFTLIEILVTFSLFLIVTAAVSGIFIAAFRSQRQTIAFLGAQNNIRFALESTAREMRTGSGYQIITQSGEILTSGSGRGENGDKLAFVNQKGEAVRYRLQSNRLEKSSDGGSSYDAVTAETVTIESFRFILSGAGTTDNSQPRMAISLKAKSQVGLQQSEILVQTSVTQRELDS
ncbi:MAG: type II secretion system protein [Parcubacteria group bacterium]|nr:type II secretion system protein [Parcubacteria group bacterium]